jgi:D-aminopeptidase
MVNGKSSLTWKIFLHGYHAKGTTEQSVVVHHKTGRAWIVGYHVDK